MNLLRRDIKNIICEMAAQLDDDFFREGFARRKNGLVYARKIETTTQKIEIIFSSHPSYDRKALAHIYPFISVYFPEISNTVIRLSDAPYVLDWMQKFTVRQPMQAYRSPAEGWYLLDTVDYNRLAEEIKKFVQKNTFPLLNQLKSTDDYLKLYENTDTRIMWNDLQYLCVVSAYINKNEYEKAYSVLNKRFGKPGLRKKYGKAFYFFDHALGEINENMENEF